MLSGVLLVIGIVAAIVAGTVAIIFIACITAPWLKEKIQQIKEKKKKSKVAFGDVQKIINDNAQEIIEKAPHITMDDLANASKEAPYFIAEYDPTTDEIEDITQLQTNGVDSKVESIMDRENGIVIFD